MLLMSGVKITGGWVVGKGGERGERGLNRSAWVMSRDKVRDSKAIGEAYQLLSFPGKVSERELRAACAVLGKNEEQTEMIVESRAMQGKLIRDMSSKKNKG